MCVGGGDCPSGFYADLASMSCVRCVAPCGMCSDVGVCKSCLEGFLYGSACYSSCP